MRTLLVILLLGVPALWGQAGTTLVTAQIRDSNNTPYVNCQWSVTFIGQALTGGPYLPDRYVQPQQGTCDSNGNLTVNLGDNVNTITPTPSQWQFNICSATGYTPGNQYCFSIVTTISGPAQNISQLLTLAAPVLPLSPNAVTALNNNWTGANNFRLGLQSIPPALPEVDIAADPSGTCDYNYSILSLYQAAKICNNGTYLGVNYFGTGFTPFLTILQPSAAISTGSIPQFTARGFFEIVPTPWPTPLISYCTGTVGSAFPQTYILAPDGSSTGCGGTGIAETPLPIACTASKLYVTASAAGAVAGSGVITLYKNGTATSLTCTLGTGTTCNDLTDSVSFSAGDTKSIRIATGQGTDTTANPRASFLCQ